MGYELFARRLQTGLKFTREETDKLTHRIQFGGDEVVKAKDGTGM